MGHTHRERERDTHTHPSLVQELAKDLVLMGKPPAPVLLAEAVCDQRGIEVKWMVAGNADVDSHTVTWKAESWWKAASATIPGPERAYQIINIPPNEKVSVWVYSTNSEGSSSYSNTVGYVSTRDCCMKEEAAPDFVSKEIQMFPDEIFRSMYTPEFQEFVNSRGKMGKFEVLENDDAAGTIVTRITPYIDPKIRSSVEGLLGKCDLSYEEHISKDFDKKMFSFEVKNFSMFSEYIETANGEITVSGINEGTSQVSTNINFRLKDVPVFGYYISQLIRRSFEDGSAHLAENIKLYKEKQGE